ncbi:hypothetical protein Tco_0526387 [Tanacetum coccineum]
MHIERGDGVTNPKQRCQDFQDDIVRDLTMASKRSQLKVALEDSTWRRQYDTWVEEPVSDVDEVIPEDNSPKLIEEFQNVDKHVPTVYDQERMKVTLRDMMSNQFRNAKEYGYHLGQSTNYMENQIVWESRQEDIRRSKPRALVFYGPQRNPNEPPRYLYNKDLFFLKNGNSEEKSYILLLYKIHVVPFLKDDQEEKMSRWINHRRVRTNPEEYFSNHRIVEVVRVTTEQQHGLDFLEQIIMKRENDKPYSYSEADFKYLNKNDIEDLYYLCQNKKVDYRENIVEFFNDIHQEPCYLGKSS